MARLLCCFHTVPDLQLISSQEWEEGCATGHIDTSYIKKEINGYDESALELSCRFMDNDITQTTRLSALTIGGKVNDSFLKTLAALGFSVTARIEPDNGTEELSSEETTELLLAWICRQEPCDILITGVSSGDGNQSKVPVFLAESLGIRCITNVTDFRYADERGVSVTWQTDDAICSAYVQFPVLLAVGAVQGGFLRVPTLKQRMMKRDHVIETSYVHELTTKGNDNVELPAVTLLEMQPYTESRETVIIDEDDPARAAEKVAEYYGKWLKE